VFLLPAGRRREGGRRKRSPRHSVADDSCADRRAVFPISAPARSAHGRGEGEAPSSWWERKISWMQSHADKFIEPRKGKGGWRCQYCPRVFKLMLSRSEHLRRERQDRMLRSRPKNHSVGPVSKPAASQAIRRRGGGKTSTYGFCLPSFP